MVKYIAISAPVADYCTTARPRMNRDALTRFTMGIVNYALSNNRVRQLAPKDDFQRSLPAR